MADNVIKLGNTINEALIETGAALNIKFDDNEPPVKCTFAGKDKDQHIFVIPPSNIDTIEYHLPLSNRSTITYGFGGEIFTFQSRLLEIINRPLKLLILEYPTSVNKQEFRSQKRINCYIAAKIEINHQVKDGVIKNISKRGCRCVFEIGKDKHSGLHTGDTISLSFRFPGIIDQQDISGKIKDIQINNSQLEIGVEFSENAWWVPPYG